MSKFLSRSIQKSGLFLIEYTNINMSKRNAFHKAPRFKPEVKMVNNRSKNSNIITNKKEKVEILMEPIKSESDKKLYK